MNKKIITAIAMTSVFAIASFEFTSASGGFPGSQSDPLVTKSYVDNKVKSLFSAEQAKLTEQVTSDATENITETMAENLKIEIEEDIKQELEAVTTTVPFNKDFEEIVATDIVEVILEELSISDTKAIMDEFAEQLKNEYAVQFREEVNYVALEQQYNSYNFLVLSPEQTLYLDAGTELIISEGDISIDKESYSSVVVDTNTAKNLTTGDNLPNNSYIVSASYDTKLDINENSKVLVRGEYLVK